MATCLLGFDQTPFPEASAWTFTRFYLPRAFDGGYRLTEDAQLLWTSFEAAHHKARLTGALEIPMESFTRAVEIVLKDSLLCDAPTFRPDEALWAFAVRQCGYVQARQATSRVLAAVA